MATYTYTGNAVTNTASGSTVTWRAKMVYTITDYPTYVSVAFNCYMSVNSGQAPWFNKNRITGTLAIAGATAKSYSGPSSDKTTFKNDTQIISYSTTYQKTTTQQTKACTFKINVNSYSSWKGTSTATLTGGIVIPALAQFTIDYNSNGGSGSIDSVTKYYGIDATLSDGTGFSRTNHSLINWNTASDGTGAEYEKGSTFTENTNLTLYAMWHLDYISLSVTGYNIYRVSSAGSTTETDDGERIHIDVDYVGGILDVPINPTIKIEINGTTVYHAQQATASGTFSADYGTYSKDISHSVVVTVYDSHSSGFTFNQTIASAIIPIDILIDNNQDVCMGIMTAATAGQTLKLFVDAIYPIGSYYETSDTSFNPNTYFGGTWILETEGQVHISAGTNYSVSGALTNVTDGGSADAIVPYHNHSVEAFNTPSGGAHTHAVKYRNDNTASGAKDRLGESGSYKGERAAVATTTGSAHAHTIPAHDTQYAGTQGNEVGANLPPYIIVNRWHRTA